MTTLKRYTTTSPLNLAAGLVVGLSFAQAETRAHALDEISRDSKAKTGVFRVRSPIQFKAGEVIAVEEGSINKALAAALEGEGDTQAKAADKKRSAAADKQLAELKAKAEALDALQPELQALRDVKAAFDQLPPDVQAVARQAAADAAAKAQGK